MIVPGHRQDRDVAASRRRVIADAPSLQALVHPTRLALLEAIAVSGPLTATQASGLVGESPTACAYHLRMLGRLGFVKEAEGGIGRERPWQLAQAGLSFGQHGGEPEVAQAADTLSKALTERFISRIRSFELKRGLISEELRNVTGFLQSVIIATPGEMEQLREELIALTSRYADRMLPGNRPPGSRAFELVMFTHLLDEIGDTGENEERRKDQPDI
jgi:DNA-binding transcriptional ArsR family regulator